MITVDFRSRVPIYEQIVKSISSLIANDILTVDQQLPSVRSLARDLAINPNTVQKAYQELESIGLIYQTTGRGSFVSPQNQASNIILEKILEMIREPIIEGKKSGVPKESFIKLIDEIYKEGISHD